MIDEAIPNMHNEKYQGISIPLSMDEKWILHLLFEENSKRSYIVGMWLSFNGKYHTQSLPELYKVREGLRMYARGLITKEYPTSFYEISDRKVSEIKEKSVRCRFVQDENVFIDELEANAILQLWMDSLKGYSITKLLRSMSIFSASASYCTHNWQGEIERFGQTKELLDESDLPKGLKDFMDKNIFSSPQGQENLREYAKLKTKQLN